MNIKVIYSAGGDFAKGIDEKITDDETIEVAQKVTAALNQLGHSAESFKVTPSKIKDIKNIKADVIFNLCEWTGKDSHFGIEVLHELERRKIPYTGPTAESDLISCSKISMKRMFDKFNIPTPNWVWVDPSDSKEVITKKIDRLPLPVIVKPAYEHCGVGINYKSVIKNKVALTKKIISLLKKYNEPIVVEEFIDGREFTITVLKNSTVHVFPPAEVIFNTKNPIKVLSFEAKWHSGTDTYSSKILEEKNLGNILKDESRKIFNNIVKKGYVRIDFRVRNNKAYALEFNVLPSLLPEDCYGLTVSTEAEGWSFNKLVDEIAQAASTK